MRGRSTAQTSLITLLNVESRIPERHPIRESKRLIEKVFRELDSYFDDLYAERGGASIPPERLLGAKVLMALYTVRSDRQLVVSVKVQQKKRVDGGWKRVIGGEFVWTKGGGLGGTFRPRSGERA